MLTQNPNKFAFVISRIDGFTTNVAMIQTPEFELLILLH